MDLLLDVYEPVRQGVHPVPERKPAYILSHGGGNSGGAKEQYCFQGSAGYMASRGFVAFNIDYRLAHAHGLLPPGKMPPAPSPAPAHGSSPAVPNGAKLVSHIQRSPFFFSPHPQRPTAVQGPHEGPLMLPGEGGNQVCITPSGTVAADGSRQLLMEPCEGEKAGTKGSTQVWKFAHWTIQSQPVVHAQSGLCLDIAGISAQPTAGLPVVAAPCVHDHEDESHAQLWQLGWSGALITRGGSLSVTVTNHTMSPDAMAGIAQTDVGLTLGEWTPNWASAYPAVRDLKAAIRFVRANAEKYGIDPSRIVVSGGSAGATNSVAAGITFDQDYNKELTVSQDPTLATTHQDQNSSVQCVVAHWSTDLEAYLPQMIDPANRSRFTPNNAPIVEFHGSVDGTINISHARDAQARYAENGVPYQLHVLEGCAHGAWCYNGKSVNGSPVCSCSNGVAGYDDTMDTLALPFVAQQLKLPLV